MTQHPSPEEFVLLILADYIEAEEDYRHMLDCPHHDREDLIAIEGFRNETHDRMIRAYREMGR